MCFSRLSVQQPLPPLGPQKSRNVQRHVRHSGAMGREGEKEAKEPWAGKKKINFGVV